MPNRLLIYVWVILRLIYVSPYPIHREFHNQGVTIDMLPAPLQHFKNIFMWQRVVNKLLVIAEYFFVL